MKRTIIIDMDGPLYPFHQAMYDELVSFGGYNGSYIDFWTRDHRHLSDTEWINYVNMSHLYEKFFLRDEDRLAIELLKKYWMPVIVTARDLSLERVTRRWMKNQNINLPIVFSCDKGQAALDFYAVALFDDQPKYIDQCRDVCITVVQAMPYNKDCRSDFRCYNLWQFATGMVGMLHES
jgi:hypothetical protein